MNSKAKKNETTVRLPRVAYAVLGIVGLLIAYSFGTRAIDSGSLIQYGASILVFIISIRLFVQVFKRK